mmetsp:Transcript_32153/g.75174  ORF Transcript_32153/g.75174 Transcript_32153/m.75174 type:complete len:344 (-) Transcript_32153:31-1062(-)
MRHPLDPTPSFCNTLAASGSSPHPRSMMMSASLTVSASPHTLPSGYSTRAASVRSFALPKNPVSTMRNSNAIPLSSIEMTEASGMANAPFWNAFFFPATSAISLLYVIAIFPNDSFSSLFRNSTMVPEHSSRGGLSTLLWCSSSSSSTGFRFSLPCIFLSVSRMSLAGSSAFLSILPAAPALPPSFSYCSISLFSRFCLPDTKFPSLARCWASFRAAASAAASSAAASSASLLSLICLTASGSSTFASLALSWAFCCLFALLSVWVIASVTLAFLGGGAFPSFVLIRRETAVLCRGLPCARLRRWRRVEEGVGRNAWIERMREREAKSRSVARMVERREREVR